MDIMDLGRVGPDHPQGGQLPSHLDKQGLQVERPAKALGGLLKFGVFNTPNRPL